MLETCFIHLPGVGPAFVQKLADAGVLCWNDALAKPLPCGGKKAENLLAGVRESQERLAARDIRWFGNALPPAEQWRLYPYFKDKAAYVDIETTGLSWPEGHITTIALYDGGTVRTYVEGRNLEQFADDIKEYDLLVTWNGRGFDAPILRKSLNIPLDKGDMGHLDLLPVFRALGLRGGLKKVEKALGIDRDNLDGVDGWMAVRLWREFRKTGNERVLETLLAYNVADVLSLEYLAGYAVMRHTGLPLTECGVECVNECNPFAPDDAIVRKFL
ncbi:MAG: hypothetical protein DELT_01364 [Desulfovibrio sp.]